MWLDHGQPDLFTWAESPRVALTAVVDASVFYDLHAEHGRSVHVATAEVADAIASGQLELVIAPELDREISRHGNAEERRRLRQLVGKYRRLAVPTDSIARSAANLVDSAREAGRSRLTEHDHADLKYVAAASAAGVEAFVTKDESFPRWGTNLATSVGVEVLDPRAAIIRLDEIARASSYSPRALQGTSLSAARLRADQIAGLHRSFINNAAGEKRAEFKHRMNEVLGSSGNDCQVVGSDGRPLALWSTRRDLGDLIADLVRVDVSSPLSNSLAEQLVFTLRDQARRTGASRLIIGDTQASKPILTRLDRDGFVQTPGGLTASTLACCQARSRWATELQRTPETRGSAQLAQVVEICELDRSPTIAEVAEFERLLWPAKMSDSPLPTYLIPIKQHWSSELFGIPAALEPRSTVLGLSREHIYYRAPRPAVLSAPARVVWYLTQGTNEPVGPGAFACSRIEEVVADAPEVLFARFKHLGVYEKVNVDGAAKRGLVQAVRVADTKSSRASSA